MQGTRGWEAQAGGRTQGPHDSAWVGWVLLAVLLAMTVRAAWPSELPVPSWQGELASASHWPLPTSGLEESLSLLGWMPLCARRGALRMRGRG